MKVRRRPNPDNKNPIGRCTGRIDTGRGLTRCDLRKGHDGAHAPRPHGSERKNGK